MTPPAVSPNAHSRSTPARILVENLVVLVACVAAGCLSKWLTVPSLCLTPAILKAGVAMSAMLLVGPRIVPAIVAATWVCTYFDCAFDGTDMSTSPGPVVIAWVTAAFVGEALLGRFLARRFLREQTRVESVPTGLHLMMLVGPCATIVGALATVGPGLASGNLQGGKAVFTFLAVWVARTIAVWIVLLPVWAWISNPRGSRSRSAWSVALPVTAAFVVMISAFLLVRAVEKDRVKQDFEELARSSTGELRNDTLSALDGMQALVAFILASDSVEIDEYQLFVKRVFSNAPGLDTVSWLPRLSRQNRADYERSVAARIGKDFHVMDLDAKGRLRPAPDREELFPESLVAPADEEEMELQIDTAGCRSMALAMIEARRTRRAVATEPLDQGSGTVDGRCVLVFVPVFQPNEADARAVRHLPTNARNVAEDGLLGYVMAGFYARPLVQASFTDAKRKYLDIELQDTTDGVHPVYSSRDEGGLGPAASADHDRLGFDSYGQIAGRRWRIVLKPTEAYLESHASWPSWLAGVLGFTACVVLGLYGLMLSGRRGRIEELVAARTRELSSTIDSLVTANEAAQVASRAKSQFLANMSHELRTPLLSVLGFTDMMTRNQGTEAERKAWTATVHRNGKQLLAILNDVLDVARMEAGQLTVDKAPCSVVRVINETLRHYQPEAQAKGLSLGGGVGVAIPAQIETDAVRLQQILSQLIRNAIKFTERGSIRVLASSISSDRIEIRVIDTGPGVPREQLDRIFAPFTQADGSMTRRHGGTGLGLTIARRLAELLGGTLRAESEEGIGTSFVLELDVGEAARNGLVATLDEDVTRPASVNDGRLTARILVAEDSDDTQLLLSAVLGRAGAELVLAHDGRSALNAYDAAIAAGEGFDLILLDVQMPVLDGHQTARALRERGFEGPILALTAHASAADRERCLESGCDDYVSKPFDAHTLLSKCKARLAQVPRSDRAPSPITPPTVVDATPPLRVDESSTSS